MDIKLLQTRFIDGSVFFSLSATTKPFPFQLFKVFFLYAVVAAGNRGQCWELAPRAGLQGARDDQAQAEVRKGVKTGLLCWRSQTMPGGFEFVNLGWRGGVERTCCEKKMGEGLLYGEGRCSRWTLQSSKRDCAWVEMFMFVRWCESHKVKV